ncbi:hypothetical protein M7I_8048 [Glarea lozoyensis 74030]|uniref:Uncharacterized protein n=1 Tax=Glarea lozoyensis (strain ATCC 74030 / MF5533) TaxID=1104152 RepID=H0EYY6_GLAL7|nr:hypothetical protein M7I_8048 [Glarea lozoyensis 74030]
MQFNKLFAILSCAVAAVAAIPVEDNTVMAAIWHRDLTLFEGQSVRVKREDIEVAKRGGLQVRCKAYETSEWCSGDCKTKTCTCNLC